MQQPGEERRGAPGDRGRNHEQDARATISAASCERLVVQAEHPLRLREARDRKLAEIGPVVVTGAGKRGGRHHRAVQFGGDLLQPCGEIDRGPDAGEVEPAHAADIAEQDGADMQRHAEAEALDTIAARIVHGIDAGARLLARFQARGADFAEIAAVLCDRKHGEQPVTHEFQDLAAMLADGRHLAVEILVEDLDHRCSRQAVGQRGEAAQIRQPDRGLHLLGVSPADLAGPNPLAGAVADIGVEQRGGGAAHRHDFADPRERRNDLAQRRELLVGEAARLLRGPACDMDGAVGVEQRQRQIVGDAFVAHVVEEGKAMTVGIVHAVAQFARGGLHHHNGAAHEFGRLQDIEIGGVDRNIPAELPDKGPPVSVGMQRRHESGDPPQRNAGIDQPLAGLLQEGGRRRRRTRAVHQPVEQVLQLLRVHARH